MSQKLAIAVIHGIGKQDEHFAEPLGKRLTKQFARLVKGLTDNPCEQLVIEPIFWQPVVQDKEDIMWQNMKAGGKMHWKRLRRFMIDFAGDAIAYQQVDGYRQNYQEIHQVVADGFSRLSQKAGGQAPLCVIAHSLGSIIASNYLYDLEIEFTAARTIISPDVKTRIGKTPLERGETLTLFFTMGSPLAIWSLRYNDFGSPVRVPSKLLPNHWPVLRGEWINIYDCDDIIGYPLKSLNPAYDQAVKEDRQINVGNIFRYWNPACHTEYWNDRDTVKIVAQSLSRVWQTVNCAERLS